MHLDLVISLELPHTYSTESSSYDPRGIGGANDHAPLVMDVMADGIRTQTPLVINMTIGGIDN